VTKALETHKQIMTTKPLIAVVGADGFVGGHIATALDASRIVYRAPLAGEVHITHAEALVRKADVIFNAAGFRIRPGLTAADYRRSHQGATAALVPWVRPGALFLHMSSASVLGKSKDRKLGNRTQPDLTHFPAPDYARAKLEADEYLRTAAVGHDFRVIFLRPSNLYAPEAEGMIRSLLRLAKRGIILRLYPRNSRQHFCHVNLLADVVRRVINNNSLPQSTPLVIADPYTITNREFEDLIRSHLRRSTVTVPLPLPWMSAFFRHSIRSTNPRFDLVTQGEILGFMDLDSVYDPFETFSLLGIDPSHYSRERTLEPVIREGLQP
jgi:nucleoside-diphosphate-sugar epimerase